METVINGFKKVVEVPVLIVGSGPMGATYARKIVEAGIKVMVVDVGAQETKFPGDHKKNVVPFQKNMNSFIHVIQGELQKLSVPTGSNYFPTLDPASYQSSKSIWSGQNPDQDPLKNLEASAVTRSVGGMANHWTCCTPEPHVDIERPNTFSNEEWAALYNEAREYIHTPIDANGEGTQFEQSIRQQLVKLTLREKLPPVEGEHEKRTFKAMPLACQRKDKNKNWVEWSSSSTVWGDIIRAEDAKERADPKYERLLNIVPETMCMRVFRDPLTGEVLMAQVIDQREEEEYLIKAKRYVIAAGAVLTPQILFNSGFQEFLPALGKYMTEQTMTFCQIVLKEDYLNKDYLKSDPFKLGWKAIVEEHEKNYPNDPLPIPFHDPDPQVTQPLTVDRPWHTQIHRDAFSYGLVPDTYDQRSIVDLRWFGYVEINPENKVEFCVKKDVTTGLYNPSCSDSYGMPQPTFHYQLSKADKDRAALMMEDMLQVANKLGGFLPGALPQFMPPGAALHVCGTTRAGESIEDSCVDKNSRVHGSNNLFLGGCNVIPTQIACNPTLTAMCYAIVGANAVVNDLKEPVAA